MEHTDDNTETLLEQEHAAALRMRKTYSALRSGIGISIVASSLALSLIIAGELFAQANSKWLFHVIAAVLVISTVGFVFFNYGTRKNSMLIRAVSLLGSLVACVVTGYLIIDYS